ncbi:MAG: DEAD/DEAH box helicase, partial [Propionibacteriaceae bacterium]
MTHHVLHVDRDQRLPVLIDLASAPGRTVVFTRTKHGAKALARQLNAKGIPTVDLHGNLSQGARTRNMDAFHSGKATTLVATDIAARGIHVDDVALVVHADPPVEHKAYTHRSGRTARAGSDGTVVTLATADQLREVRSLTKAAGINPTTTRVQSMSDAVLTTVAPGARALPGGLEVPASSDNGGGDSRPRNAGAGRRRGSGSGSAAPQGESRGGARGAGGGRGRSAQGPAKTGRGPARPASGGRRPSGGGGGGNSLAYSTSSSGSSGGSAGAGSHSAANFSTGRR